MDNNISPEQPAAESLELTKKQKIVKEVKSISLILILVFTFRSVFFEPFRIPSGSMIPTLMIGDFILVNKFSYGFKLPFSDVNLFGKNFDPIYLFGQSTPDRGDVIVFKFPKDPAINYIKRVIGLPGDTIEIINKVVYINGQPLEAEEVDGSKIMEDMDDRFKVFNLKFYEVDLGDRKHIMQIDHDNYYKADYRRTIVPEGNYFVLGDNRDFSEDSTGWGFVPHANVKGRALFVWFSFIFPWGEDDMKFRPWRIGKKII